jgi:SAM-dependent methyltransferase
VPLIEALNRHVEGLGPQRLEAAEISGADHAGKPWKRFESLNYPAFDLCAPLAEELRGAFDVVLYEQVIEHVVDPNVAAENLRGLVRRGRHVIVSTPFLIRVHELPMYGMKAYWAVHPHRGSRPCSSGPDSKWTRWDRGGPAGWWSATSESGHDP